MGDVDESPPGRRRRTDGRQRNTRRVRRGDYPAQVEAGTRFPGLSWNRDPAQWSGMLSRLRACNASASEEEEETLPVAMVLRAERAPQGRGCLAAMEWLTERQRERFARDDRRTIRTPTPQQVEDGEEEAAYLALSSLERAKRHFDRARQLYATGRTNVFNGLARGNVRLRTQGEKAIWSVERNRPQEPRRDRTSAAWELWQGYRLIREYEVNPPPPLDERGAPNPERLQADRLYVFLMGTWRLQPNRLDIGPSASRVWRDQGIGDPNRPPQSSSSSSSSSRSLLYGNVNPEDLDHGPAASRAHEEHREHPQLTHHHEITDVARALYALHSNFLPPAVEFPLIPRSRTRQAAMNPAPPLPRNTLPYATPGLASYREEDEWPFDPEVMAFDPSYVPIFFPSGESLMNNGGPPYERLPVPLPWFGEPENAFRMAWNAYGPSDSWPPPSHLLLPHQWDVRMPLALLFSREAALKQRNFYLSLRSPPSAWENDNSAMLTEWTGGPVALPRFIQTAPRLSSTPRARTLSPGTEEWRLGSRNQLYLPQGTLVDTTRQALEQGTLVRHPFGASDQQLPRATPWDALPADREGQVAMLQHALWLMDAPLTEWMENHLERSLWPAPPDEPGIPVASAGHGLRGRQDASLVGWAQLGNPFEHQPVGGVPGRRYWRGRRAPRWPRNIRLDNVAVGPLCLSPRFGSAAWQRNHEIDAICDLWVIRTNQQRVLGENTWGLDFFSEWLSE